MTAPEYPGQPWFPPGLDSDVAQAISDAWWDSDPHWAAYLAWTAYAATLPPTPAVASVGTGVQTVAYSPATPVGEYGAALQRAEWHKAQSGYGGLISIQTTVQHGPSRVPLAEDVWVVYPAELVPQPKARA